MFTIHPFDKTDEQYAEMVHIANTVWPDHPTDVEAMKFQDERRKADRYYHCYLIRSENGQAVGIGIYCESWWNTNDNQYDVSVDILPEYRRQGAGTLFFEFALEKLVAERNPTSITVSTREDKKDAVGFLEKRGFVVMQSEPESLLDLTTFDRSRFGDLESKMKGLGITLLDLAELQKKDPNWKEKLFEMSWELEKDVPYFEEFKRPSYEEYEKMFHAPSFIAEGWAIAIDDATGEYAGMSSVWYPKANPEEFQTGLTGVVKKYRRKGIATAMKIKVIDFALAKGIKRIRTDNDENNPMLGINKVLGFVPQAAWLSYEKKLNS